MSETLELAKKLGLVRYKMLDDSSSSGHGIKSSNNLKYLFVIDFESTCWEEKVNIPPPEIIEFPVVLLCLSSGKIVSEFHYYCQPMENPRLSPFCKNLTGITQELVDDGVPLATCLVLFRQWFDSKCREYRITVSEEAATEDASLSYATCVTWSDWDLSLCLENECKRKQIRKPECFNAWIDIRSVYRSFYNRRPQGLNNALREVGLEFEGREHSGIEDARNTAKLVWRMVNAGCQLHVTAAKDENSSTLAKTAHRRYSTGKDDDGGPLKKSKWKHFKPDSGPKMAVGVKIGPPPGLLK